ncbi:alpha-amylase 4N [Strongylocentrotus purpuratus]|uniref:alpha-amylase n=1 Tax=Strongylocentrotus purpuratus TaxID=7668 RepID=A0A7M7RCW1_STRPU|nr:alpha-amylase 4N [Strongylocentrotus purpuratus]
MRILTCFLLLFGTSAWAASSGYGKSNFKNGRSVIVHLFEWTWNDIAKECERFLGPYGFAGVQISPPSKQNKVTNPWRPWYERYQPMSYELTSRSGDEADFRDMVERCRKVDVLIYVDAVINHMAAKSYEFSEVPYSRNDFNVPRGYCSTSNGQVGNNYHDADIVRNCDLVGLNDILFGSKTSYYADKKVASYMNKMIDMGVAGFRIDAAKHMWPGDLKNIFGRLHTVDGSKPYIYQEVIDRNPGAEAVRASEYVGFADVTEFIYCDKIVGIGTGDNKAKYFKNFGEDWGMMDSRDAFVFVDNHDNQRSHGGGGDILTYKDSTPYKKALAFGMAWNYGIFRVMSSFYFDDPDSSPPAHSDGSIKSPIINSDGTCDNGWVCEHRWRQIKNMACFRNAAGSNPVENWYDNGDNFIAFSRGNRAFFAINNQSYRVTSTLQTGLPAGEYCDVISGDPTNSGCAGTKISVNSQGKASISIHSGKDSMIAIHVGAKSGSGNTQCHW